MGRRLGRSLALPLLIAVSACPSTSESPGDQIRALIAKAEKAAEEKDLGTLKDMIHDGYADKQGNKKPELVKLLAYYLLRTESIHLLTRIRTIEFPEPKRSACGSGISRRPRVPSCPHASRRPCARTSSPASPGSSS